MSSRKMSDIHETGATRGRRCGPPFLSRAGPGRETVVLITTDHVDHVITGIEASERRESVGGSLKAPSAGEIEVEDEIRCTPSHDRHYMAEGGAVVLRRGYGRAPWEPGAVGLKANAYVGTPSGMSAQG